MATLHITHALEVSLALGLLFFVALPALVMTLVSVTVVIANGERVGDPGMRHPSSTAPGTPLAAVGAGLALASAAVLIVVLAAAVIFIRPAVSGTPAQTAATVGDLHYAVNNAWVLDPERPLDAAFASGLPQADRALGADELLLAVFVGVTNETDRRVPMAKQLALQDSTNHVYAPVPLGPANRYAYRAGTIASKSHQPAPSSPAGSDQSAEGLLLVFRIPLRAYDDGGLALIVRDPADPARTGSLQVL